MRRVVRQLRIKLALNFVIFVLFLYTAGALAAVGIFRHGLSKAMDSLLVDLLAEIRPAVQVSENGMPSLKTWAHVATTERMQVLATVQVFDKQGKLLERYGPPGVPVIRQGRIFINGTDQKMNSLYAPVMHAGKQFGTIEVQVSTAQDDRAIAELIFALVVAVPVLVLLVAGAGYVFAGMALKPVEKTMDLLRHFVADAGHELKTPLSVIEASIETLGAIHEQHSIPATETEMIRKASERMKGLTADLMFLAKVEDPMAAFDKIHLNLNHLIEEVVTEYEPLAATHGIELSWQEHTKDIQILAEPESFRQLISNLVSNGIKYNDPGGRVEVSVKRDQQTVQITVADTGIGIAEDHLSSIFDRFYRADKSRSREAGGAGLGLAIVKAVANAHNATVTVSSELGKGTTFTVSLPT